MTFRRRQLVAAALTANALSPLGGRYLSMPAFFAGWLAGELAPQLLATTLVDAAAELTVRRSRTSSPSRTGLALAAVTTAGLGYLIVNANRSATQSRAPCATDWAMTTSTHSRSRPRPRT